MGIVVFGTGSGASDTHGEWLLFLLLGRLLKLFRRGVKGWVAHGEIKAREWSDKIACVDSKRLTFGALAFLVGRVVLWGRNVRSEYGISGCSEPRCVEKCGYCSSRYLSGWSVDIEDHQTQRRTSCYKVPSWACRAAQKGVNADAPRSTVLCQA